MEGKLYHIYHIKTKEVHEFASLSSIKEFLDIKCHNDLMRAMIDGRYSNWIIKIGE